MGDTNKSLVREQQRTGNVKEEMKSSTQALIRAVCSSPVGNLNEHTSRWEEHILNPAENAKQYLTENTSYSHGLGWIMSDTQHAGQEAKLSDKNFPVTDGENNRNMRTRKVGTHKARYRVEDRMGAHGMAERSKA